MAAKQPPPPPPADFRTLWLSFVESSKLFLVPVRDDRALDQFLVLRDKVYVVIQHDRFIEGLDTQLGFKQFPEELSAHFREAFLEELRACVRAAEVTKSPAVAPTRDDESRVKTKDHLAKLSTTLGSLKDLVSDIPYLKIGVGLYKELVDFFK
jgi:hypothetical protein